MTRSRMVMLTAIMGALIGLGGSPALAADEQPSTPSKAAVAIQTANAEGPDDRGKYDYEILPQGVQQDWVAVSNYRYQPITVRLFAKDATSSADSAYDVQTSDADPVDVGAWIALQQSRITIPGRSTTRVPFQIGVPTNASPGDHAGAIVVSLLTKERQPGGGTITVDNRVGLRVYLRVPGTLDPRLEVTDLKASWDGPGGVLGRSDARVTYTVRNTGNVRLSADQAVTLTRSLGLPSVSAEGDEVKEILPGGSLAFTREFSDVFGTGPMNAVVTLEPHGVDASVKKDLPEVSASTSMPAWPWILVAEVVALLLLLLGGWFGYRRRKSLAKGTDGTDGADEGSGDPDGVEPPASAAEDADAALVRTAKFASGLILALSMAVLLPVVPAQAADDNVWQAKLSAKSGTDLTPFDVITTGGCPLPGTNIVGVVNGAGFEKGGTIFIGNTDAGVRSDGPFQAPAADTLRGLMAMQVEAAPFRGVYTFTVRCIKPENDRQSFGEYVVAIRFSDANNWKVEPPLTTAQGPDLSTAPEPGTTDEPAPGSAKGGSDSQNGADGANGAAAAGAEQTDRAAARAADLNGVTDDPASAEGGGVSWPLMVAGLVVLAGVALMFVRRRSA